MFKFDLKSLVAGIIIGSFGLVSVFAGSKSYTAAESNVKMSFYSRAIEYENSVMSITNEITGETKLYIPMRETLEKLGYSVNWRSKDNESFVDLKVARNASIDYAGYYLTRKYYPYLDYKPILTVGGAEKELIHIEEKNLRTLYEKGYMDYKKEFSANADLPYLSMEDEISIKFETAPVRFVVDIEPVNSEGTRIIRATHSSVNFLQEGPFEYKFNLKGSIIDAAINPEWGGLTYDEIVSAVHIRYAFGEGAIEGEFDSYEDVSDFTDVVFFIRAKR